VVLVDLVGQRKRLGAESLRCSGPPINEPIVSDYSFMMSTRERLDDADAPPPSVTFSPGCVRTSASVAARRRVDCALLVAEGEPHRSLGVKPGGREQRHGQV
jgi:hypothetical protein